MIDITPLVGLGLFIAGIIVGMLITMLYVDSQNKNSFAVHDVPEKLCPCGHIHKPSSNGKGLRTYCVEGSQCNSDKCKDFVKHALGDGGKK